jgi:hypothetical protein
VRGLEIRLKEARGLLDLTLIVAPAKFGTTLYSAHEFVC